MFQKKYLSILSGLFFVLTAGCSQGPLGVNWQSPSGSAVDSSLMNSVNPYEAQAVAILQTNCISCHGASSGPDNVYDLTDSDHLIAAGLVVPGQPTNSTLYGVISSGAMPQSGSRLSASDLQVISNWIQSMAQPTTNPGGSSTTTTLPSSSGPVGPVSFAQLENDILIPKCSACHSRSAPSAGFAFDTFSGVSLAVDHSSPKSSLLYVETVSAKMPQGGAALTADEENEILTWIQEGALNN